MRTLSASVILFLFAILLAVNAQTTNSNTTSPSSGSLTSTGAAAATTSGAAATTSGAAASTSGAAVTTAAAAVTTGVAAATTGMKGTTGMATTGPTVVNVTVEVAQVTVAQQMTGDFNAFNTAAYCTSIVNGLNANAGSTGYTIVSANCTKTLTGSKRSISMGKRAILAAFQVGMNFGVQIPPSASSTGVTSGGAPPAIPTNVIAAVQNSVTSTIANSSSVTAFLATQNVTAQAPNVTVSPTPAVITVNVTVTTSTTSSGKAATTTTTSTSATPMPTVTGSTTKQSAAASLSSFVACMISVVAIVVVTVF